MRSLFLAVQLLVPVVVLYDISSVRPKHHSSTLAIKVNTWFREIMASTQSTRSYTKQFVTLESDPELFTKLIHTLGASQRLNFQEIYSIDDPHLLSFVPKPIHALILVLPTTPAYEKSVAVEDCSVQVYTATGKPIWISQTINNAYGLYAILHAIANSKAKQLLGVSP